MSAAVLLHALSLACDAATLAAAFYFVGDLLRAAWQGRPRHDLCIECAFAWGGVFGLLVFAAALVSACPTCSPIPRRPRQRPRHGPIAPAPLP